MFTAQLTSQGLHQLHPPSHPPISLSHLYYTIHFHSGIQKEYFYIVPRLQVHSTTFSLQVALPCLPMDHIWCQHHGRNLVPFSAFCRVHGALGSAKLGPQVIVAAIHWSSGFKAPQSLVLTDYPFSLRAMAPGKTKQPLEPPWAAAPAAVGWPNAKASRHSNVCGLSWARSKVTFPGPMTHFESWDLPINLDSCYPTQRSRQWQRIQLPRVRG